MGRLSGLPERQFCCRWIVVGNAPASFERRRVAPLEESVELGFDRRILKDSVRSLPVPNFPVKNVIGLFFSILSEYRGAGLKSPMRINQNREIFVIHFNQFSSVRCCIAVFS